MPPNASTAAVVSAPSLSRARPTGLLDKVFPQEPSDVGQATAFRQPSPRSPNARCARFVESRASSCWYLRPGPVRGGVVTDRGDRIVSVLEDAFAGLMAADPAAFRHKFRKMAAEPFTFYRGSACLFYADMAELPDEWTDERTSRIWIQGDLHAQNFGTYMDSEGTLVFDVNDFDEAYLGSFTWDLRRFAASMALLGWRKALPDSAIA